MKHDYAPLLLLVALATMGPLAHAVPGELDYQAFLTNADGTAFDGDVSITFAAYTVPVGGVPQWTQTTTVTVEQGLFTVALGGAAAMFPANLFDTDIYIGLFVAGEEMLPRRKLRTSAYAFKADDADTVGGISAAALDQSADVAALQGEVTGLDGRVTTLEATDISSVSGVDGLAGGGSSGNVQIAIANEGVTAAKLAPNSVGSGAIADGQVTGADIANGTITIADMAAGSVGSTQIINGSVTAAAIATNAVGSNEIADGAVGAAELAEDAVGPSELDESQRYTIESLQIEGSSTNIINSQGDFRIHDDVNGFRWYDGAGTTQFGYIFMSSSLNQWVDSNQGSRRVFYSDSDGIGVGTTTTTAGYGVTVPSLSVLGQTAVGLTRVTETFTLSSFDSSCHSHGEIGCYTGSGTVNCPVGTRVLGGGTSGHGANFGSMSRSYPNSDDSWFCTLSYDLANVTRTCYAICARLE